VTPSVVCAHCRRPCASGFEITRFDRTGAKQSTVVVCSAAHLIVWAYEFATISGMRIAYDAKQQFESFMTALRGGKLL
jgi:hypothetical protein